MKTRFFLCVIVITISFFSLTPAGGAYTVPWLSQSYESFAAAGEDLVDPDCVTYNMCSIMQTFGPPLPISASAAYDSGIKDTTAYSEITASTMLLQWYRPDYYFRAKADARFTGNYIAAYDYFVFSFSDFVWGSYLGDNSAYVTVKDISTSATLLNEYLPDFGSPHGTYYIPTIAGDEIEVSLWLTTGEMAGFGNPYSGTYSISYSMSVVPEPVSSILFITGGTLFAGRRFIRKSRS